MMSLYIVEGFQPINLVWLWLSLMQKGQAPLFLQKKKTEKGVAWRFLIFTAVVKLVFYECLTLCSLLFCTLYAVTLAAAGLDFIHRITRGLPIFGSKKGHERKSYKQLQSEALEKKEKEKAVFRLNGGVWPGERTPSHALGLWAGGSELTSILEHDHKIMPDKFVSYELRKELAEIIPGLRPWEVFEIEQIMESVTYGQKWYREPLSSFTMRADYDDAWFKDYKNKWEGLYDEIQETFRKVDKKEFIKKLRAVSTYLTLDLGKNLELKDFSTAGPSGALGISYDLFVSGNATIDGCTLLILTVCCRRKNDISFTRRIIKKQGVKILAGLAQSGLFFYFNVKLKSLNDGKASNHIAL
ncbi:hypothetical protein L7F22_063262 [Adiantum nelumboides]|nr:hypothetical protein [Adiantum nelumboides]